MARLTAAARRAIPRDRAHFLVPSKAPGPGSYPIIDKAHKVAAAGLAAMHGHPGIEAKAKASLGHHEHVKMAHQHVKMAHRQHTTEGMREHLHAASDHLKRALGKKAREAEPTVANPGHAVGGYDFREDPRNAARMGRR
jgi:hypothetical protein